MHVTIALLVNTLVQVGAIVVDAQVEHTAVPPGVIADRVLLVPELRVAAVPVAPLDDIVAVDRLLVHIVLPEDTIRIVEGVLVIHVLVVDSPVEAGAIVSDALQDGIDMVVVVVLVQLDDTNLLQAKQVVLYVLQESTQEPVGVIVVHVLVESMLVVDQEDVLLVELVDTLLEVVRVLVLDVLLVTTNLTLANGSVIHVLLVAILAVVGPLVGIALLEPIKTVLVKVDVLIALQDVILERVGRTVLVVLVANTQVFVMEAVLPVKLELTLLDAVINVMDVL